MILLLLISLSLRRGHWRRTAAAGAATAVVLSGAAAGNAGPLLTDDMAPLATDANPSFGLIAADLDFILQQIEISEAHAHAMATGDDAYSLLCASKYDRSGKCVRDPMLPHGLRTVDGSFNNLEFDTTTGRSNKVMPRMLPIRWRNGEAAPFGAPPNHGDTSMCDEGTTCYEQTSGMVYDTAPRVISNLIVDNSTANPLVAEAAANNPDADIMYEVDPVTGEELTDGVGELYLPSLAADEGLSAPVNMWFVFFGQFFDHGLDLVEKNPDDAVIVPLMPDDPLTRHPNFNPRTAWLAMSRATNTVDADGNIVREHENRTTPWVDQNQTYTSHPAHQVFLREYELLDGRPVDTGRLLNGVDGGLATWDDVQRQAREVLGIELHDLSVLNVPQVGVDLYGNFVPGPNGFPQLITPTGSVEGSIAEPVDSRDAIALKQSFLDDIAHGATPLPETDPGAPAGYDNVALGQHFITGDGRGNENIGLTAVHHVFHSEHNRLVDHIHTVLDANPALKERYQSSGEEDDWSFAQRVFQAARFTNEMQYQHLVFEEFARTVQPAIDAVVFNENSYDSTIDASIRAEFAHVVYRFGHSMLTEDILRQGFGAESASLLDGFLNPVAFHCAVRPDADNQCAPGMELTSDQAAGAIVNGTTNQVANQIDELVTSTLRNDLLGLPLDLATINIMRGRDTGVPGLNEARRTFYAETGNPALEPYSSWRDFGLSLKNGENFGRGEGSASLVNFVAAYGTHPTITEALTLTERRVAAQALVNGVSTINMAQRIAGADRFLTAALVSRVNFTTADTVYLASGVDFPDALAGGPAASIAGAPVLLVRPDSLPAATAGELLRLQPKKIVVLGGSGAVTDGVVRALRDYAPTVQRIAGKDRYDTAALVAAASYESADRVYLASGAAFPDALGGSAAAGANQAPLLLVRPGSIPTQTAAQLARLQPKEIVILGGEGAVSRAVANALPASAEVTRLGGKDRYATSELVSQHFAAENGVAYLATGQDFPDALAAASSAGAQRAPILLTRPGQLSSGVGNELLRLNPNQVLALGGTVAIGDAVVSAVEALFPTAEAPADRDAFMNSTGEWANAAGGLSTTGLEDVDFWVGGLAEALDPFGGMLGSTFNHVFEQQLEDLQFGDRFYYLFRNQGNQLFAALEANSFSSLIQRNTDASLLPADIFVAPNVTIDLENMPVDLPAGLNLMADGTWRWDGDEHVEIHGNRTLADKIRGGQGDDSLWGYGGDDRIEGGSGNDSIQGGSGHDIITDAFGDDNIKGGSGNDAIDGGPGIDILHGQSGNDFITKTSDNSDGVTAFLGTGNDVFLGGTGRDTPFGNEGDDWLEGGPHSDLLVGDNSQQFQDNVDGGNDVLIGGANSDDHDAEGGDDIMVGSPGGTDRFHGMLGFDYVTYDGTSSSVDADLNFNVLQPPDVTTVRDRYLQVEALSGGQGDDVLRGQGIDNPDTINDNEELDMLDPENLDLIDGMRGLLQPAGHLQDYSMRFRSDNAQRPDNRGVSNLILGGAGSDLIEGRFSDDFIDGDAVLKVWLEWTVTGERFSSAAQMKNRVFSGEINPGDIEIVREIVDEGQEGDIDTAYYADPYGDPFVALNYEITELGDGYWQVRHAGAARADRSEGADILRNVERLQFGDGACIELVPGETEFDRTTCPAMGSVGFSLGEFDAPEEDVPFTATVTFRDEDGNVTAANPKAVKFNWQVGLEDGSWVPSALDGGPVRNNGDNTWSQVFTPGDGEAGNTLRVMVTFRDDAGMLRQITSPMVGDGLIVLNVNDAPTGLTLSTTTPRVGQAVLPSGFTDPDGTTQAMEETGFTYTWQTSSDGFSSDIRVVREVSTLETNQLGYLVQPEDLGRQLRVVISYEDDQFELEEYASDATAPVVEGEVAGPPAP